MSKKKNEKKFHLIITNHDRLLGEVFEFAVCAMPKIQDYVAYDLTKKLDRSTSGSRLSAQVIRGGRQTTTCRVFPIERPSISLSVVRRSFLARGLQNSAKENEDCVLTSFSLLRKWVTLARRVDVGARLPLLFFGFSCFCPSDRLSPVRANYRSARSIGERNNAGGFCPSLSLSFSLSVLPSLFFFARVQITLVCEGPLAIGMKVGSCVEMESPGPRLYTHLPTRASGQDRARGPRPSSPIEPPGGAPLSVFSSPPFLDSICLPTYLPILSPSLSSTSSFLFLFLLHCFSRFCLDLARFCLHSTRSPILSLFFILDIYTWLVSHARSRKDLRVREWIRNVACVADLVGYNALSELNSLIANTVYVRAEITSQ